jgi:putative Mn2+ efflux pump MntP
MNDKKTKKQKDPRGKMISGIILLGLGVLFLLNNLDVIYFEESWPFILILVGLAMLIGAMFRNRDSESSALPPPA